MRFILQEIFYSTHQFFISQRSVYLIVFSLVKVDDDRIEYWLKAIRSGIVFYIVDTFIVFNRFLGARKAPILIVGTHLDHPKLKREHCAEVCA